MGDRPAPPALCFFDPLYHSVGCRAMALLIQTSPCCCCHSILTPHVSFSSLPAPPLGIGCSWTESLLLWGSKPQGDAREAAAIGLVTMVLAREEGDSSPVVSTAPQLRGQKSSRPLRAMGVETGQLDSSTALRKVGRGSRSRPSCRPLSHGNDPPCSCSFFPQQRGRTMAGAILQCGGFDWFAFGPFLPLL